MSVAQVDVDIDHGHCHIAVSGEIDLDNAALVDAKIHAAMSSEVNAMTVDLTEATYLDSVGMRVLFMMAARLQQRDVPLIIVAEPHSIARRAVELSGLTSLASLRP